MRPTKLYFDFRGRRCSIREISAETGVDRRILYNRLVTNGMDAETAVGMGALNQHYTLNGERKPLWRIEMDLYIGDGTLRGRAKRNGATLQEEIDKEFAEQKKARERVEGEIMNRAIIIGNLTKDPETRKTKSGTPCTTFTVAVARPYSKDKETDFLPVVTFRTTAENCAKYLAKGRKVCVEGSIQTRSYDAQDGSKRYVTEIIADSVEFLSPADNGKTPEANGYTETDEPLPF